MLILTRKCGESVLIGEDIRITVSQIRGDRVKLGVDAPKSTRVIRSELKDQQDKPARFLLGRVVITSNCEQKLEQDGELEDLQEFLLRHSSGDWGSLADEDKELNWESLKTGQRLMSCYSTAKGTTVWIITDAVGPSGQREATTFLLPEDY